MTTPLDENAEIFGELMGELEPIFKQSQNSKKSVEARVDQFQYVVSSPTIIISTGGGYHRLTYMQRKTEGWTRIGSSKRKDSMQYAPQLQLQKPVPGEFLDKAEGRAL